MNQQQLLAATPRIEVCGGIASGKTTLVSAVGHHMKTIYTPVFEDFSSNPFYLKFYSDPAKYAFEAEITFLIQHFSQINECSVSNAVLLDYSLSLDLAYAYTTLMPSDRVLFESVLNRVLEKISKPSLILHVSCSVDTQYRRIIERGRPQERNIPMSYLENLNMSISRALGSNFFSDVPVISVNSDVCDFRRREDGALIAEKIASIIDNNIIR